MRITLECHKEGQIVETWDLSTPRKYLIGRDTGCQGYRRDTGGSIDIALHNETCSRRHAWIQVHAGGVVTITDAASTCGTHVMQQSTVGGVAMSINAPPHTEVPLTDGSTMKFGESARDYLLRISPAGAAVPHRQHAVEQRPLPSAVVPPTVRCNELPWSSPGLPDQAHTPSPDKKVKQSQAFLSHNWGRDALGKDNHERVSRINAGLRERGISTWFDESEMEGHIGDQMANGIEGAKVVVAFITRCYMEKVDSDNRNDNCKREFQYAVTKKNPTGRLIAVPMEPDVTDPSTWFGAVGLNLSNDLYPCSFAKGVVDAELDKLAAKIKALCCQDPKSPWDEPMQIS